MKTKKKCHSVSVSTIFGVLLSLFFVGKSKVDGTGWKNLQTWNGSAYPHPNDSAKQASNGNANQARVVWLENT